MGGRPTLEAKLADLANRFRFFGVLRIVIAILAGLFSPRAPACPIEPLAFALAVVFSIGLTSLICGQLIVRRLVGFGSMEPPPVTIPEFKD